MAALWPAGCFFVGVSPAALSIVFVLVSPGGRYTRLFWFHLGVVILVCFGFTWGSLYSFVLVSPRSIATLFWFHLGVFLLYFFWFHLGDFLLLCFNCTCMGVFLFYLYWFHPLPILCVLVSPGGLSAEVLFHHQTST